MDFKDTVFYKAFHPNFLRLSFTGEGINHAPNARDILAPTKKNWHWNALRYFDKNT